MLFCCTHHFKTFLILAFFYNLKVVLVKRIQNIQHTTHNIKHTTYNKQHTTHNIQHTVYNTQHTTHNTQHTTYNTQHTCTGAVAGGWYTPLHFTR